MKKRKKRKLVEKERKKEGKKIKRMTMVMVIVVMGTRKCDWKLQSRETTNKKPFFSLSL